MLTVQELMGLPKTVELAKEEYQQWLANPTTEKVCKMMQISQLNLCQQMGAGATLSGDPGETQKLTAMNAGLVEGIMMAFSIDFSGEENGNETE